MKNAPTRPRLVEILCALGLALVLHRPGLLSFGNAIPGSELGDTVRAHWSAWFMAAELPAWPFSSRLAGFPHGVELIPLPPISLALVAPVTAVAGASMGLVALLIFHTILCVLAGSFLARTLGAQWGPALGSGIVLATTPILGESLRAGIFEYQTIGWMTLMMGALVRACQGHWKWGFVAGVLYLVTLLECGYYGSAAALAAPVVLIATIRSQQGARAACVAATTVGIGAWFCLVGFSSILSRLRSHMQNSPEAGAGLLSGDELLAALPFVGWEDPYNGMIQPYYASPSLLLWLGATIGLVLAFRKTWWLGLLSILFLLLALGSPVMSWWSTSELGRHVGMPKRYVAPLAIPLCALAAIGTSLVLTRWKSGRWLQSGGLGVGVVAGILSANGNGLWTDYPLLWTPSDPSFVDALSEVSDGAIMVIPQEQPEDPNDRLTHQPSISSNPGFENPQARLWWQTRFDRPMRHYSRLGTLVPISDSNLRLDEMPQGHGAPFFDTSELQRLQEAELRAILIDYHQLDAYETGQSLRVELENIGAVCEFHSWNDAGVDLCVF